MLKSKNCAKINSRAGTFSHYHLFFYKFYKINMPDPEKQKGPENRSKDISTPPKLNDTAVRTIEGILRSGNPNKLAGLENVLKSHEINPNTLEAIGRVAQDHITNLAGWQVEEWQLSNNLYNKNSLKFPKLQEVFNLAIIRELTKILSDGSGGSLAGINITFINANREIAILPAAKFISNTLGKNSRGAIDGSITNFPILYFSRNKEFANSTPTLVPNPQTPRQLEDPQLEKNVKFNAYTNSKENGKIAWSVEVDTENAFYVEDKDGNRKFVVITMKGIAEDNKEINLSQAFYQSTGVNSGHEGEWFPCRGVSPTDIMDKYIVKHINTNAPKYLSNGNSRMPNPLTRMGSFEFILSHGGIFNEISKELSKHNIKTTKNIPYEQINTELKNISPDVDLEFQPETDNTIIPIPQPTRPLS